MDRADVLKDLIEKHNSTKSPIEILSRNFLMLEVPSFNREDEMFKRPWTDPIVRDKPNIRWSDVVALEEAKMALREAVVLPVVFPQVFSGRRKPWNSILLFGPPGTGKSILAKAVAAEVDSNFFSVSSADLFIFKCQGENAKLVRSLFCQARKKAPSIVFIDEIDLLYRAKREGENESGRRVFTEFLVQMSGFNNMNEGFLVIGSTNFPWALHPAMRRRFEKRVYIPLPDAEARAVLFEKNTVNTTNSISDLDFKKLGEKSKGYLGADICVVVREAVIISIRSLVAKQYFKRDMEGCSALVMDYPPCPFCPMKLLQRSAKDIFLGCPKCYSIRMSLYQIPESFVKQPQVALTHLEQALDATTPSVSQAEIQRFEKWNSEFGREY